MLEDTDPPRKRKQSRREEKLHTVHLHSVTRGIETTVTSKCSERKGPRSVLFGFTTTDFKQTFVQTVVFSY